MTNYQEGEGGILLSSLTPPHCCACPNPGPERHVTFNNISVSVKVFPIIDS